MKKLSGVALLGLLASCNTFEGIGRDLAAGGEAIEGAAVTAQQPAPVIQPANNPFTSRFLSSNQSSSSSLCSPTILGQHKCRITAIHSDPNHHTNHIRDRLISSALYSSSAAITSSDISAFDVTF